MATSESDFLAFVRSSIAARIAAADAQIERARKDRSPDAVHDLRVAFRRLLNVLACFEQPLGRTRTRRLRKSARAILSAGGSVRDRDIALGLAAEAGLEADSQLVRVLQRQRALYEKELGRLAGKPAFRDLAALWNEIADGIGWDRGSLSGVAGETDELTRARQAKATQNPIWSTTESCTGNARRVLPGLAAGYFALGRSRHGGDPRPNELHDLRLAGKRLRYHLELFRDHYSPLLVRLLKGLRTIQSQLGAISDCAATEDLLEGEGVTSGQDGRRLTGFLRERRQAHVAEFLGHWATQFDAPGQAQAWVSYLGCCGEGLADPRSADRKPASA